MMMMMGGKGLKKVIYEPISKIWEEEIIPHERKLCMICPIDSRSQWSRGLRRRFAAAHLLRWWVQIPPGAWIFVCCECRVLTGRGLCDELITRSEESYRLWCVVVCDLETSRICAPYIYDIRSVRGNDLTLILLTWRKW